jgi:hypothetical protein
MAWIFLTPSTLFYAGSSPKTEEALSTDYFSVTRYGLGLLPAVCSLAGVAITYTMKLQTQDSKSLMEPLLEWFTKAPNLYKKPWLAHLIAAIWLPIWMLECRRPSDSKQLEDCWIADILVRTKLGDLLFFFLTPFWDVIIDISFMLTRCFLIEFSYYNSYIVSHNVVKQLY